MSFMMALLLAVVMGLLLTENLGYGHIQISRPVFAGPIIGLLMGDLETGLIVGKNYGYTSYSLGVSGAPGSLYKSMLREALTLSLIHI